MFTLSFTEADLMTYNSEFFPAFNVCQLERTKQEVRLKDDSLRKLEENCQNLENKAKGKEQLYKTLQEKVQ